MKSLFSSPPLVVGGLAFCLALACSTSNPDPTSGSSATRSNGRILALSETGTDVYILDLEQGIVETQSKSVSNSAEMIISPEGQFALMVQSSGNRVDLLKMGTSVVASTEESSSGTDDHGHDHGKPRLAGDHDHGSESSSDSSNSESSSTSTSSVDQVDISITGDGLGHVVARGQWMSVQFSDKIVVIAEEDLENKLNSISETIVHEIVSSDNFSKSLPAVPMDEEHIAIGNWIFEIKENGMGANLNTGSNVTANGLVSANILSATRSGEGTALFGTDQGLLVVGKHTESGNVEWEDLMVPYPTVAEANIFLAEEHDHGEGEEEAGHDEHEEVEENRAASEWATMDGLGHAFAHLTHEDHSAGIYLVEAEGKEEPSEVSFEYLDGTSSSSSRPMLMTIVTLHEEEEHEEEEEEEHTETQYLLILMSSGNLRVHDAVNEGAFVRTLDSVISPITDFHAGENNLPGMSAGLGKVFIGDPSSNEVHQIDLETFQAELTWNLSMTPNRLLLMGESTMSEGSGTTHDHD